MSGTRYFNNIETRAVINFLFLKSKAPKEIHAILIETLACFFPGWVRDLLEPLYKIPDTNKIGSTTLKEWITDSRNITHKPRGRRDRGYPGKRWQGVDAGTGQKTYSLQEDDDKCCIFQRFRCVTLH